MISDRIRHICIALVIAAILVVLAGCTAMSHVPTEGWPALKVIEHSVPHAEMVRHCQRYISGVPVACAEWNFALGTCHIWYSQDLPSMQHVIEHERLHCQGFDHPGSTTMSESLRKWRSR